MSKVIVFATPVFLLMIALEYFWGRAKQRQGAPADSFRLNDTLNSVSLGMMSQLVGVLAKVLQVGLYTAVFSSVTLTGGNAAVTQFWSAWYGVVLALVFYDLCYYWLHRAGHEVAVFWAAHVVHHQSQSYNLSTALRQSSSGSLLGWIFYLPMALAGVPPVVFGTVALIDLLYQFWVHTEHVGKLGWFDRVFCSPSNHRVHHAVNDGYLDKNYGGIWVVWDRLFGTFKEEGVRCVYGTRSALNSWDPLWSNAEVYWSLAQDSWRTRRWGDKLRVWFKPPGWRAPDLVASRPKPAFDITAVQIYNPTMSRAMTWFASVQFALLLLAVASLLWVADSQTMAQNTVGVLALAAGMWALGAAMQGRLSAWGALAVQSAALATATRALGFIELHYVFKPLTMVLALIWVIARFQSMAERPGDSSAQSLSQPGSQSFAIHFAPQFKALLCASLLACMAGDVLLMLPGNYFLAGLAAFLVGHLFYIAMLRVDTQTVPWFPNRVALAVTLLVAVCLYLVLWPGLRDPVLKAAVALYALVIALMAAQAIGRATSLRTPESLCVALGACFFMLSDSLIAINRFVQPLPMEALWVLSTYYVAQMLIAANAWPTADRPAAAPFAATGKQLD